MAENATVTLADVLAAREVLGDLIRTTPMVHARVLSEKLGTEVFLKCENLQRAGSFKIRGAYNRLARLSAAEKARGVVAASAGNHAQGVALRQQPRYPVQGLHAVRCSDAQNYRDRAYGAEIEQVGHTLDEAIKVAERYAADTGAIFISRSTPISSLVRAPVVWRFSSSART